jgi:hypothetical protein
MEGAAIGSRTLLGRYYSCGYFAFELAERPKIVSFL